MGELPGLNPWMYLSTLRCVETTMLMLAGKKKAEETFSCVFHSNPSSMKNGSIYVIKSRKLNTLLHIIPACSNRINILKKKKKIKKSVSEVASVGLHMEQKRQKWLGERKVKRREGRKEMLVSLFLLHTSQHTVQK